MKHTWFTSDTHFGHANIIRHSNRPFDSVEAMDRDLIDNWNSLVLPKDDVWHLGDFNFRSEHTTEWYVQRLNGRINIVWGNHDDRDAKRHPELFASNQEVKYLRLNGQRITLYHYAQRTWRNSHHGSWHLFGHSHGCLPDIGGRSMDVGVDANSYLPVSFEFLEAYMKNRPPTQHHPA